MNDENEILVCGTSGLVHKDCWCNWCQNNEKWKQYQKLLKSGWYMCEHGLEDHRNCDICTKEREGRDEND